MTTIHADQITKLTIAVTNKIEAFVLDQMMDASQWTSSRGVDKATNELEAAILAATIKYMRRCQAVPANGG